MVRKMNKVRRWVRSILKPKGLAAIGLLAFGGNLMPAQCAPPPPPPPDPLPYFYAAMEWTDRWPNSLTVSAKSVDLSHDGAWVELNVYCIARENGGVTTVEVVKWHEPSFGTTRLQGNCPVGAPYLADKWNRYMPTYDTYTWR